MDGLDELEGLQGVVFRADEGARALEAPPTPQDGAENGATGPGGPGAATNYAAEAGGMVDLFAGFLCGVVPEAATIWTPEAKERTTLTLAPVLEKYELSLGGGIPCELVFAVTAGPLLWQSAQLLGAKLAQAKRKAAAEEGRTVDATAARIVPERGTPGAPNPADLGAGVHEQVRLYRQGGA